MEAYPQEYVAHNYPFVVLSGLSSPTSSTTPGHLAPLQDGGQQIVSDLPPVTSNAADQLRDCLLQEAGSVETDNGRPTTLRAGRIPFRVTVAGRTYRMPARKADRESTLSAISMDSDEASIPQALTLHSPISPLSLGSPVFPDGFTTPLWVAKHQQVLPSAFISFYTLSADPNRSSLLDNHLKNDINNIKQTLANSSPRTRYAVVLLGEESIVEEDVDERIPVIRQATKLDPRTSLFYIPVDCSRVELQEFCRGLFLTLQPLCVEYYRDLTKHSRRKRGRGTIPPPTVPPFRGTSQTLSSQGWSVRYEFKLGVFAEFRQEMETAARHFEAAYEGLLGQDVFESIAAWSPRWNEARLLADTMIIRLLRCHLWNQQTTTAVRRWQLHRVRIKDLLDRRGKGSSNYGWEAWNASWAKVMAQMIRESRLPAFAIQDDNLPTTDATIYLPPEKGIPVGERLMPWLHLHHPGYWMDLMSGHVYARRRWAQAIPEEDRTAPGQSPASQVANKSHLYDTYLCPHPHEEVPLGENQGTNHSRLIVEALNMAIHEFGIRGQTRAVDRLKLEVGKEHINDGKWVEALRVLRPLWHDMSWRREGWWLLVEEVCWALYTCARNAGDGAAVISTQWELMSNLFSPRPEHEYDMSRCLDGVEEVTTKPAVVLRAGEVISFLSSTFTFQSAESNVGSQLVSQLVVRSRAHQSSAPTLLSAIRITFEGASRAVLVTCDESERSPEPVSMEEYMEVDLKEPDSSVSPIAASESPLHGEANLWMYAGQTKIFNLTSLSRTAGDVRVKSITLSMATDEFDVDYIVPVEHDREAGEWWTRTGTTTLKRHRLNRERISGIKILPRPPKMQLRLLHLASQYYTNEQVTVTVEVMNGENEDTEVSLEARILGEADPPPQINWDDEKEDPSSNDGTTPSDQLLQGHSIGRLRPLEKAETKFFFTAASQPVQYVLEIKVVYHQLSEPDTPISKTLTRHLPVIAPFDASYDFSARIHEAAWPSYFDMPDTIDTEEQQSTKTASGVIQRWVLSAVLTSLATEPLLVDTVELQTLAVNGDVICSISDSHASSTEISPQNTQQCQFTLDVQKLSLDDRRSAALDLALMIHWRRSSSQEASPTPTTTTTTTMLHVPRLLVHGGEPRILAAVQNSSTIPGLIHLEYTLENPSLRLLTLTMVMEMSEDFAFYGPKAGTLQLVPISRHTVRFNLYPTVKGGTWIQPQLKVVDRYFNKTLRVIPTEGMKVDKNGILIWVDDVDG
ncbi:MAG: hypothetical protein M1823_000756 [Watsoniomyces obsoletus]|nr:MAG: hypothetical protein M1823_000756 [Watsoniomyces obsoletus]